MKTLRAVSRYLVVACSLLCAGLVLMPPVQAQTIPNIASAALRVDANDLNRLWFEAIDLVDNQKLAAALLKLKEVEVKKAQVGLKNLPDHSAVLIRYANRLKKQRQPLDAIKLIEAAQALSPDSAEVYFALAGGRFAANKLDLYGVGHAFVNGTLAKFTDILTIAAYANNILGVVIVSGLGAGIIFILFSFIYYQRAFFFQVKESFPLLPLPMVTLVGWIVIGVVTLGFGIFWGMLLLAAILIVQVDPVSKRGLQGFLCFGLLIAPLLIALSISFTVFQGGYFQALREVSYGHYSERTINILQRRVQEQPDDAYALFGLAYIAGQTGHAPEAIAAYTDIPGSYPDRAAVQNNLGNLYHREFRRTKQQAAYRNAEEAYQSAIRMAPRMFEPRYNSAQLIMTSFANSQDAEAQLAAASNYDKERYTRYTQYLSAGIFMVDAAMSPLAVFRKLTAPDSIQAGFAMAKRFWKSGSRFDDPWWFSGACLVLLIMAEMVAPQKGAPRRVLYCQMCGDAFAVKRRKKKEKDAEASPASYCTECSYIFKKKTTVKPEKRVQKVNQIQLRQRFRGLIALLGSLCCPGGGQIYFGYPGKGLLLALAFSLATAIVLLKYLNLLVPLSGMPDLSLIALGIGLVVIAGIYLFNLYDMNNLSPKNQ